jgi:23S rRNA pseudouridine1911/1915/1917 synthase
VALLDYVLRTFPAVAHGELVAAVHDGRFRLSTGEPLGPSSTVQVGMTLLADVLPPVPEDPFALPLPERIDELFCDPWLVAIDKPPSLLCYPLGARRVAAMSLLQRQLATRGEPNELRPLHRLDRETSGVLLFARELEADRRIKKAFQKRRVAKAYLALVRGRTPEGTHEITVPIGPDDGGPIRMRMRVRPDGQPAETVVRALGSFGETPWPDGSRGYTWVEARPRTGRTHQIRVHLAWMGHPLVGDKLYLDDGRAFLAMWDHRLDQGEIDRIGHARHALHAWTTALAHPMLGTMLHLRAPLPADLLAFATRHGGGAPMEPERLEVPE